MTAKAAATTTGPIFFFLAAVLGIPAEVGLRTYMDDEIMAPTSLKGMSQRRLLHFKEPEKLPKFRKFRKSRKDLVKLLQKILELMETG